LLSKAGALIAAGPPVAFAALDALKNFQAATSVDIFDRLTKAASGGINSLAVGFGFPAPFAGLLPPTPPSGVYRTTFTIGLTMMITDAVQSLVINLAARRGNRAVRFMGKALTTGR
jgi:hypothetical protein